jgi:hypothetical protein
MIQTANFFYKSMGGFCIFIRHDEDTTDFLHCMKDESANFAVK